MKSKWFLAVWSGLLAVGGIVHAGEAGAISPPAPTANWHRGVFRVNSDISSGRDSVEAIATKAEAEGLAFIVFADQFLVRAEYGLPPIRHVLKVRREQASVARYGVADYLARLAQVQQAHPKLAVIPGVDVAPALWWSGSPFRGDLTAHQFSEQMTVFGPDDPAFYRDLPVMFNSRPGFRFPGSLLALLPLLLCLLGGWLLVLRPAVYYEDRQGNRYCRPAWPCRLLGGALCLAGLLWLLELRPFTVGPPWSPYQPRHLAPFQAVCDHVRARGGEQAGVVWSHPEITMSQRVLGVSLVTIPYLDDVVATRGHNGLAGLYGDVARAHEPGQAWDRLLGEYVRGERQERPVVVGESDYHGGDRPFNVIQTVVRVATANRPTVVRALLAGQSYALYRQPEHALALDEATVAASGGSAALGETLAWDGGETPVLKVRGHLDGPPPPPTAAARITVVVDGQKAAEEILSLPRFEFSLTLPPAPPGLQMRYVRFHIQGTGGQLLANPIFVRREPGP